MNDKKTEGIAFMIISMFLIFFVSFYPIDMIIKIVVLIGSVTQLILVTALTTKHW